MNPRNQDPLLRYASLSAAGLPVSERHLALAATRWRAPYVVLDHAIPSRNGAIRFSVTTSTHLEGEPVIARKPRRLVFLSY